MLICKMKQSFSLYTQLTDDAVSSSQMRITLGIHGNCSENQQGNNTYTIALTLQPCHLKQMLLLLDFFFLERRIFISFLKVLISSSEQMSEEGQRATWCICLPSSTYLWLLHIPLSLCSYLKSSNIFIVFYEILWLIPISYEIYPELSRMCVYTFYYTFELFTVAVYDLGMSLSLLSLKPFLPIVLNF